MILQHSTFQVSGRQGRVSTFLSPPLALLSYQFSKVILGKNHLRNLLKMQILLSCLLQLALGWNVEPRSQNFKQVSSVSPVQVILYLYFGELCSTELLSRPCTILTLSPRHPTSLRSSHLNTGICGLSSQSPIFIEGSGIPGLLLYSQLLPSSWVFPIFCMPLGTLSGNDSTFSLQFLSK